MRNSQDWIDLSHPLRKQVKTYPGDPKFVLSQVKSVAKDGYRLTRVSTGMHVGTHIDFPSHFLAGGKTSRDYPPELFIGRAARIDAAVENRLISTSQVKNAYFALAERPRILILATGHSRRWDEPQYFTEYPVFENDFSAFVRQAGIKLLFTDLPTVRYLHGDFETMHRELLEKDILIGENLMIPDHLGIYSDFVALPLPIEDLEASIVRAMAKNI